MYNYTFIEGKQYMVSCSSEDPSGRHGVMAVPNHPVKPWPIEIDGLPFLKMGHGVSQWEG